MVLLLREQYKPPLRNIITYATNSFLPNLFGKELTLLKRMIVELYRDCIISLEELKGHHRQFGDTETMLGNSVLELVM